VVSFHSLGRICVLFNFTASIFLTNYYLVNIDFSLVVLAMALLSLPVELLVTVARSLPSAYDLYNFALVSKRCALAFESDILWRPKIPQALTVPDAVVAKCSKSKRYSSISINNA